MCHFSCCNGFIGCPCYLDSYQFEIVPSHCAISRDVKLSRTELSLNSHDSHLHKITSIVPRKPKYLQSHMVTWPTAPRFKGFTSLQNLILNFIVTHSQFLATLVALHFTPVSESLSRWAEFRTSVA